MLINSGADVNSTSKKWDDRPLFFFAKDEKMMSLLLKSGVDVNAVDNQGKSYLHYIKDKKLINLIEKTARSEIKN